MPRQLPFVRPLLFALLLVSLAFALVLGFPYFSDRVVFNREFERIESVFRLPRYRSLLSGKTFFLFPTDSIPVNDGLLKVPSNIRLAAEHVMLCDSAYSLRKDANGRHVVARRIAPGSDHGSFQEIVFPVTPKPQIAPRWRRLVTDSGETVFQLSETEAWEFFGYTTN